MISILKNMTVNLIVNQTDDAADFILFFSNNISIKNSLVNLSVPAIECTGMKSFVGNIKNLSCLNSTIIFDATGSKVALFGQQLAAGSFLVVNNSSLTINVNASTAGAGLLVYAESGS